jgi:hypothetical protein
VSVGLYPSIFLIDFRNGRYQQKTEVGGGRNNIKVFISPTYCPLGLQRFAVATFFI